MLFLFASFIEGYARKATDRYVKSERSRRG